MFVFPWCNLTCNRRIEFVGTCCTERAHLGWYRAAFARVHLGNGSEHGTGCVILEESEEFRDVVAQPALHVHHTTDPTTGVSRKVLRAGSAVSARHIEEHKSHVCQSGRLHCAGTAETREHDHVLFVPHRREPETSATGSFRCVRVQFRNPSRIVYAIAVQPSVKSIHDEMESRNHSFCPRESLFWRNDIENLRRPVRHTCAKSRVDGPPFRLVLVFVNADSVSNRWSLFYFAFDSNDLP